MKTLKYIPLVMLLTLACSGDKKNKTNTTAVDNTTVENVVFLTAEQISAINIQTGHIEKRNLKNVIKANGYFDVPPQNNAVISPMISGYVRKINYLVGDVVKKGAILAEMESMEYIDLQQQYMETNARMAFLKAEYDRQKLLRDKDAISKKQYLAAEIDYEESATTLGGLKSKLQLVGVNFENLEQGKIDSRIYLRAPISGSVKTMNTVIGRYAAPTEELFEIVDGEHLHLELSVYEKDALKVIKGQKVWFKSTSQDNTIHEGEVILVGQDLSENKRTIKVHVHILSDESQFTVGMYANATIVVDDTPSFSLPVTAIVAEGNNKYLFKREQGTTDHAGFRKISVFTGIETDGLVELKSMNELSLQDDIVIDGAFYLLNAFSGKD